MPYVFATFNPFCLNEQESKKETDVSRFYVLKGIIVCRPNLSIQTEVRTCDYIFMRLSDQGGV